MNAALRFVHAARRCEIRGLEQLAVTCELVADLSAFIHVLQRERGVSNLHVATCGDRFAQQLEQCRADCVACEQTLRSRFDALDVDARRTSSGVRLFTRIADVLQRLDELPGLRVRIRSRAVSAEEASGALTRLIRGLLAVVFEAADTATDPSISRALVAMFHFMQGKELAGQERASGAAGFAAGHFDAARSERMAYLAEAQERCFDIFVEFAHPDAVQRWRATLGDAGMTALQRLRRMATAAASAAASASAGTVSADAGENWFDLASRRIDEMKSIEDSLALGLATLCNGTLAQARAELERDALRPAACGAAMAQAPGCVAVFLDQRDPALKLPVEQDGSAALAPDGMGPNLHRSIVDLVQEQSLRLQAMNDELTAARAALNERKLIERAKGLLMQHQELSEEEAYRLLRRTAMEQGRRLADVAETVLGCSAMFARNKAH